jgi:hypothetical protein
MYRVRLRGGGGDVRGGKKWVRRAWAVSVGPEVSGREGNLWGGLPNANLLAVQTVWGVAEERKSVQWALLAEAMALK